MTSVCAPCERRISASAIPHSFQTSAADFFVVVCSAFCLRTEPSYAECYPGAFETTIEVYDAQSDDDDPSKIDLGTGAAARKVALKRWDFKTEEEWAAYNAQREANPKAAFQFGVKMADGRKTRKDKDKDKPKKKKDYGAKVNSDLQKVNALMKKRENEGYATLALG